MGNQHDGAQQAQIASSSLRTNVRSPGKAPIQRALPTSQDRTKATRAKWFRTHTATPLIPLTDLEQRKRPERDVAAHPTGAATCKLTANTGAAERRSASASCA